MRPRWRYLRFGPASVVEISADGKLARVLFWGESLADYLPEHADEDVCTLDVTELPPEFRRTGARMWYVDSPNGFKEFLPRPDGETLAGFECRWRAARTSWWQFWRWPIWAWRIPIPGLR
jgi:hypothetical protein